MKSFYIVLFSLVLFSISACSPEVGSDKWCEKLNDKPKGDWTADEATDYARHCLFK